MSIRSVWPALFGGLLLLVCSLASAQANYADPPGRVAFLSHSQGDVVYSPSGIDDWTRVVRNRPLIGGDRLWTDRDGRAELQIGSAAVRLGANTSFEILALDDQLAQLQLTEGVLNLSVRRLQRGQSLEIATPTLAFVIDRPGRYRIDVSPEQWLTTVVVWEGSGEAYGDRARFVVEAGEAVSFYDTSLSDYEIYGLPRDDEFDRYCRDRDRRLAQSGALRYVNDDLAGFSELDDHGRWRRIRNHGDVWFPNQVASDWAPYRDGNWVWQEPWGWTWIDNAPWGFAPSHYGRWVSVSNRWGWIPGPRNVRPVYAPALVAFIGGSGWNLTLSSGRSAPVVGWFPLGPREVYVPSYRASRDYFSRVNLNNTVITTTVITTYYGGYSRGNAGYADGNYAYRRLPGAVTAVPNSVFINAGSVRGEAIRLERNMLVSGELSRFAPLAPSARSVLGAAGNPRATPGRGDFERAVVARSAVAVSPPFAARERQLQRTPGQPLPAAEPAATAGRGVNPSDNVRVLRNRGDTVKLRAASTADAASPAALPPLERRTAAQSRQRQTDDRQAVGTVEPDGRAAESQRATPPQPSRSRQPAAADAREAPRPTREPPRQRQAAPPAQGSDAPQDARDLRQQTQQQQTQRQSPQRQTPQRRPDESRESRGRDTPQRSPETEQRPPQRPQSVQQPEPATIPEPALLPPANPPTRQEKTREEPAESAPPIRSRESREARQREATSEEDVVDEETRQERSRRRLPPDPAAT